MANNSTSPHVPPSVFTWLSNDKRLTTIGFCDRWFYVVFAAYSEQIQTSISDEAFRPMLARSLGLDIDRVPGVARRLAKAGLIDPVTWCITNGFNGGVE